MSNHMISGGRGESHVCSTSSSTSSATDDRFDTASESNSHSTTIGITRSFGRYTSEGYLDMHAGNADEDDHDHWEGRTAFLDEPTSARYLDDSPDDAVLRAHARRLVNQFQNSFADARFEVRHAARFEAFVFEEIAIAFGLSSI